MDLIERHPAHPDEVGERILRAAADYLYHQIPADTVLYSGGRPHPLFAPIDLIDRIRRVREYGA